MKRKRKKKQRRIRFLVLLTIVLVLGLVIFFQTRRKLQVVSVVSRIDGYDYYLESNATSIYKKYYKELEKELKKSDIDEKRYVGLVASLFVVDYYTLNNKITNKDIGGESFIHSDLKEKFLKESSETIYKYVENNLYGNRKQKLPEVKRVDIKNMAETTYDRNGYKDDKSYKVDIKIQYVKNLNYQTEITLFLVHENNKISIVEID